MGWPPTGISATLLPRGGVHHDHGAGGLAGDLQFPAVGAEGQVDGVLVGTSKARGATSRCPPTSRLLDVPLLAVPLPSAVRFARAALSDSGRVGWAIFAFAAAKSNGLPWALRVAGGAGLLGTGQEARLRSRRRRRA